MLKLLDRINQIVGYLCAILMVILTLETVYVIVMRYVFNAAPSWGEVISRFLMVYACMFGFSTGIYDNSHARIKALDWLLPEKLLYGLDWFCIACMILFSLFMIIEGTSYTILCSKNMISGLNIRSSFEMICIPTGGVFCLLQTIRRGILLWRIR